MSIDLEELADLSLSDQQWIFETRTERFTGEAARERATYFLDQQSTHWRLLLETDSFADTQTRQIISFLKGQLQHRLFELTEQDRKYTVTGRIPLLTEKKVAAARHILEPVNLASALIVECADLFENQQLTEFMNPSILVATVRYMNGGMAPNELLPYVKKRQAELAKIEFTINRIIERSEKTNFEFSETTNNFIAKKAEEIEAFKRSVGESIRFGDAAELWKEKANSHRWGFYVWFAIFTISAGGVGWYLVSHIKVIADSIPKDKDGALSYSSLIFFIVPVVAFGWVLRLISRFINNQLVLSDDARHRDVMTKTYLALVAEKDSQVDQKDRLVMLNAIFRPLPGAQVEDIAPPTIMDLLKKD